MLQWQVYYASVGPTFDAKRLGGRRATWNENYERVGA
jgi:hypothetical protein